MAITKVFWAPLVLSGTTIFVIFAAVGRSKFAKGVVKAVRDRLHARRKKLVSDALQNLWRYAPMVADKRKKYQEHHKKYKAMSDREKVSYLQTLKAAHTEIETARIFSKQNWDVLKDNDALPIDPLTGKHWDKFDDFIERSAQAAQVEEDYASCA